MTLKKVFGKIHLWLGLSSGLVVFIVAITGAIFAFEEELFNAFHSELVYVRPPVSDAAKPMNISALQNIAHKALGGADTVYKMLDGKVVKFKFPQNPHPSRATIDAINILDVVAEKIKKENPAYYRIFISKNIATNTLTAGANFKSNSLWTAYNYHLYDLTTGKEFGNLLQINKTTGQKWRNSNYDLHTGKTLGYAGMTLAFCSSIIIASLPITGLYIWWGQAKEKTQDHYIYTKLSIFQRSLFIQIALKPVYEDDVSSCRLFCSRIVRSTIHRK